MSGDRDDPGALLDDGVGADRGFAADVGVGLDRDVRADGDVPSVVLAGRPGWLTWSSRRVSCVTTMLAQDYRNPMFESGMDQNRSGRDDFRGGE